MSIFDVVRDPTYVGGETRIFATAFARLVEDQRFDADRYDPKYDAFFKRLRKAGRVERLGDFLKTKPKRGVQPTYDANGTVYVINSQQVHADKIDLESCSMTTEELVKAKQNKGLVHKYDVLLNSTGYITVGRCQPFLHDVRAVVDTHVTILQPVDDIDPVYLAVYLNCRLGYLQTERSWTGSSGQIELRREAIEDFYVLIPKKDIQLAIRGDVESAHAARREARRLLASAQGLVETSVLSSTDRT
jgi:type I restriction enzyme M protein